MDPLSEGREGFKVTNVMGTVLCELTPGNPSRPPDWRWRRAVQLLERRDRRRSWDDDWVRRCRRSLASLDRAGGDPDDTRVVDLDSPVLGAWRLRRGDPRRRWEAEARLLAGQDDDAIAARVGVEAGAIGAYEALYPGYFISRSPEYRIYIPDCVARF